MDGPERLNVYYIIMSKCLEFCVKRISKLVGKTILVTATGRQSSLSTQLLRNVFIIILPAPILEFLFTATTPLVFKVGILFRGGRFRRIAR